MTTKSALSNKNALEQAIAQSTSMAEVLDYFGLSRVGGNYTTLRKWADIYELRLPKADWKVINQHSKRKIKDIFVVGVRGRGLLRALVDNGIREEKCEQCGQLPWLNDLPLSLTVDHINGNNLDNRLENLKILCWNCHSQTLTFGAKNTKNRLKPKFCECGIKIHKLSDQCIVCSNKTKARHSFDWPETQELLTQVVEWGYTEVAKRIGCSGNAVKKHLKNQGVELPVLSRGPKGRLVN